MMNLNKISSYIRIKSVMSVLLSDRYDDTDGAQAENVEFLPGGEGKKTRFTDVSARNQLRLMFAHTNKIYLHGDALPLVCTIKCIQYLICY